METCGSLCLISFSHEICKVIINSNKRNVNRVRRIPQIYELISIKRLQDHQDLLQYLRHHRWLDDDKGFQCQKHYHGYKNTLRGLWTKEEFLKLIFSFFSY